VRRRRAREKALFRTHRPPFNAPEWTVGQVVQYEGSLYRVTRWEELAPVHLERGGSVGEWRLWGTRLSDEEIRKGVVDAAERMLEK